jgi:hypothetical protein
MCEKSVAYWKGSSLTNRERSVTHHSPHLRIERGFCALSALRQLLPAVFQLLK